MVRPTRQDHAPSVARHLVIQDLSILEVRERLRVSAVQTLPEHVRRAIHLTEEGDRLPILRPFHIQRFRRQGHGDDRLTPTGRSYLPHPSRDILDRLEARVEDAAAISGKDRFPDGLGGVTDPDWWPTVEAYDPEVVSLIAGTEEHGPAI